MAGHSAEFTKKLRAAIKAKLEELGVVDEEYSDYIIQMVTNKKEKNQMENKLLPFLGQNSGVFVDWLFNFFEKLQNVDGGSTDEAGPRSKRGDRKRDSPPVTKKKPKLRHEPEVQESAKISAKSSSSHKKDSSSSSSSYKKESTSSNKKGNAKKKRREREEKEKPSKSTRPQIQASTQSPTPDVKKLKHHHEQEKSLEESSSTKSEKPTLKRQRTTTSRPDTPETGEEESDGEKEWLTNILDSVGSADKMATRSATPPGTYVKICAYEGAKPREVPTDDKNRLLIETIKMLYPDAVGLSYVSRHGNMRVLKTDREYTYFVPPESGYQDNIFYLVYPEKTSSTVPKDSKASVEEKTENVQAILQRLSKYVYAVDGMVACATAVSDNMLATCYHCLSSSIKSGPGVEEEKAHCDAVINLTSASTGKNIQARIVIYSVEKDIALLQTLNDAKLMDGQEIALDDAYVGQPYYILGTPISDDGAPLQVISGRISAKFSRTLDDKNIHNLHGHGGARVGASGGAAFARHLDYGKAHLLGIVASGPSISHDTKIGTFVSSNYVKLISSGTLYAIYEKSVTVNAFKNSPYAFKF